MPVKLTEELKQFVSRPEVVKVLATINEDGSPNIGPKGSIQVYDDESLAYAEMMGKHHYRNVQRDRRVAIACIDAQERKGYRFEGEAEAHESGEVFDRMAAWIAARLSPQLKPKLGVRVPIKAVYGLGGAEAGEKLL